MRENGFQAAVVFGVCPLLFCRRPVFFQAACRCRAGSLKAKGRGFCAMMLLFANSSG